MARHGYAHFRNRLRKLCYSSKFAKLLRACVILVIEVLPASRGIFSDRLQPSIRSGIDERVSPGGRNFQLLNPVEVGFSQPAACRFVAKSSFRSAESTYADVLQTFEICHWSRRDFLIRNGICLSISRIDLQVSKKVRFE